MEQDQEPRLTRDEAAFQAQRLGYHITAAQLSTQASRRAVTRIPCVYRADGRPTYLLSDIVTYANTRSRGRPTTAARQHAAA